MSRLHSSSASLGVGQHSGTNDRSKGSSTTMLESWHWLLARSFLGPLPEASVLFHEDFSSQLLGLLIAWKCIQKVSFQAWVSQEEENESSNPLEA